MEKIILLNDNIDNTNVSKFDKYLSKRYFILSDNYDVILNKTTVKCIRLYDSEDDYDIDIDEDEFNSFDEKNIKYEYYKNIFIGEIIDILRNYMATDNDIKKFIGKHF